MTVQTFKRGDKVLFRRSILCGRDAEFGVIVKRSKGFADGQWYVVRDDHGSCAEHAEMIAPAANWRASEIQRLRDDADEAARKENENIVNRYKAEALRDVADRLAA